MWATNVGAASARRLGEREDRGAKAPPTISGAALLGGEERGKVEEGGRSSASE